MNETKDMKVMLGDPKNAIRSMTLPLIVSFLVSQINIFADIAWCSGLGEDAASAISAISPIYWIISSLGTGLGVGASATVSRYVGKKDKEKADSIASQTIVFTILISLVISPLIFLVMDPTISLMGARSIEGLCIAYCIPFVILCTFVILNGVIAGLLRSEGAAKKAMVVLVISSIINIIIDPILIYGLNMGIAGAGWSTSLSTLVGTMIGFYWYAKGTTYVKLTFKKFKFKMDEIREVLYVGLPKSTEGILTNFMSIIQRAFIITCGGVIGVALFSIPWKFVSLGIIPASAISAALIPVCSSALGKNDIKKAEIGYRYSLITATTILTILAIIIFIFADYLVIPFTYSDSMVELRPEFAKVLRIYAIFIPFYGMIDIGSAILQSIRRSHMSLACSLLRNGMILVLLFFASKISMDAIYWSFLVAEIVGGLGMITLAYYEFEKYKRNMQKDIPEGTAKSI